ncbi:uncharacterized protein LOC141884111 [Acropora palmata]|uniref:uncharacterized protein LOC141884111 n=1 Tax=Acropora palmata TaxID=6131 RepID=UPI003D9FD8B3
MQTRFALILIFALIFIFDDEVAGRCGSGIDVVGDTDWTACLEPVDTNKCPHGFLKINEDNTFDGCPGTRICCLLTPVIDLKIKNAPCLSGGTSNQKGTGK